MIYFNVWSRACFAYLEWGVGTHLYPSYTSIHPLLVGNGPSVDGPLFLRQACGWYASADRFGTIWKYRSYIRFPIFISRHREYDQLYSQKKFSHPQIGKNLGFQWEFLQLLNSDRTLWKWHNSSDNTLYYSERTASRSGTFRRPNLYINRPLTLLTKTHILSFPIVNISYFKNRCTDQLKALFSFNGLLIHFYSSPLPVSFTLAITFIFVREINL